MSILDEIVRVKKEGLKARQREVPASELFGRIRGLQPCKSFGQALREPEDIAIIAEIKKASPSAGMIREDFDPKAIALSYTEHGAAAISVLTEENFFQGDIEYLLGAHTWVDKPLLRKDFLIDPYQIVEARAFGADAVLLIMAALSKTQCRELCVAARECGMEFLLEVHHVRELEFALGEDYDLVGINNRDLDSFVVDLTTTEKLAGICAGNVTIVSESGIKTHQDIERLSHAGISAVLVGETLMRTEDIGGALQGLTGVPKCHV